MHDYFLFYWLMWMLVVIIYFFMPISTQQQLFIVWILFVISTVDVTIYIGIIEISISFLCIIMGAIIYFLVSTVTSEKLFMAFILMIGYGGLLMWHQLAPIWLFLPAYLLLPMVMVGIALFMKKDIVNLFPVLILAMSFGQSIYQGFLIIYQLNYSIGKIHLMTQIGMAVVILIGIYTIRWGMTSISNIVHRKLI